MKIPRRLVLQKWQQSPYCRPRGLIPHTVDWGLRSRYAAVTRSNSPPVAPPRWVGGRVRGEAMSSSASGETTRVVVEGTHPPPPCDGSRWRPSLAACSPPLSLAGGRGEGGRCLAHHRACFALPGRARVCVTKLRAGGRAGVWGDDAVICMSGSLMHCAGGASRSIQAEGSLAVCLLCARVLWRVVVLQLPRGLARVHCRVPLRGIVLVGGSAGVRAPFLELEQ